MEILVLYYMLAINLAAFITMSADKRKARRRTYRISEHRLLCLAAVGGSAGMFAAMHMFRHKTKHKRFFIGIPFLLFLHGILVLFFIKI
ncbi:DUF1294 domain-containing protein [Alteribacillus sp. YIM 98480]|uniref:DUF1294 domain-containing protein n=1 Tax=Alteribacillus sp. YIM 98480 TaxID=2606599 RepID=UPI00131D1C71|nr:DUF1294 domain-containing protein [Alteribacillus sp. YIM 98480]